jgi:NAD(P)-dependent dehydrogenase (short-subunit alcohol dehydrogenase family)
VSVLHYDVPAVAELERLEDELARAFHVLRAALVRGDRVVVSVADRDLQGAGEPVAAALAHALLGLVRALAIEGRKHGWRINLLSAPDGFPVEETGSWIERLGDPAGAGGVALRLGHEHLGRVPA